MPGCVEYGLVPEASVSIRTQNARGWLAAEVEPPVSSPGWSCWRPARRSQQDRLRRCTLAAEDHEEARNNSRGPSDGVGFAFRCIIDERTSRNLVYIGHKLPGVFMLGPGLALLHSRVEAIISVMRWMLHQKAVRKSDRERPERATSKLKGGEEACSQTRKWLRRAVQHG